MNYVYIVECKDGSLYTGWTNDLEKRLKAHNAGTGAKYTKMRYPVFLKHAETFETRSDAQKREHQIKKLSRNEKRKLFQ